jgi:hypothetical protein
MPPSDRPYGHDDIRALREEMNARLTSMESWLERVSNTLDKLAENASRIAVLETKALTFERDINAVGQRVTNIETGAGRQGIQIAKLDQLKVVGLMVAGAVISSLSQKLIANFPWLH